MKGYKGQFESNWGKGGGYRQEEEKRKRIARLQLLAGLVVILIMAGTAFLFFRQNTPGEGDRARNKTVRVNEDVRLAIPQKKEEVRRRNIYDSNLNELSISFKVDSIYVKPLEFDNIEKTVSLLADALDLDEKDVLEELKTQRTYKWVVKNISPEKAAAVAALNLPGVYFYEQEQRFNPSRANMGQIIGEVKDGHGLSGVELFYDNLLLGDSSAPDSATRGGGGKSLVLTLDAKMQLLLEQEMTTLLNDIRQDDQTSEAMTGVSALLMDADRGEVLAYVKLPFFSATKLGTANSFEGGDRMMAGHVDPGVLALIFKDALNFDQAQQIIAAGQTEEGQIPVETIKTLAPSMMKKIREGPSKSPWVQLRDGSYASDWLAAALDDEQAAAENGQVDFSDFGKILDRVGQCTLDLPGDNGGKETGIGLLCGYAALVNGGNAVTPHILQATLTATGKLEEWPWSSQENKVIGPEASRDLVLFLREKANPADTVLVGEILRPRCDMASTEGKTPPAAEGTEQALAASGTPEQEAKPDVAILRHCDGLALASVTVNKPELVMLVVIDDARIDLMQASPVKQHTDAFLQAALKLHHRKENGKAVPQSISRAEIFQRWILRNKQLGFDVLGGRKSDADTMIDVRGMSIRKALQELDGFDVKVVIEGSGMIKRQHPDAGSKLKEGTLVILKAETKR
ncbi:MAG: PASTA domain-containing protein [Proteobacteria bacterium]|nr:PASTA domain-containing protein [Pseudomonadota bacterium]MBU4294945.1 PASTA domain-containing protein [Pseudomonadota bacterium]MCG2747953.1 PASTA domain-containing protein [Desulfobulbaceae bacterium]